MAVPIIPAQVLREIARSAKVHIYSEDGDVLDVSHNLLSVHTLSGGKRIFSLPSKAEVVYDLFQRRIVATDADRFDVTLPPASTALYFFGSKSIIRQLGR